MKPEIRQKLPFTRIGVPNFEQASIGDNIIDYIMRWIHWGFYDWLTTTRRVRSVINKRDVVNLTMIYVLEQCYVLNIKYNNNTYKHQVYIIFYYFISIDCLCSYYSVLSLFLMLSSIAQNFLLCCSLGICLLVQMNSSAQVFFFLTTNLKKMSWYWGW